MSLTPAVAETLRHALATVVVVPVTPDEIRAILTGWGLA
jgi:hypothetical protein